MRELSAKVHPCCVGEYRVADWIPIESYGRLQGHREVGSAGAFWAPQLALMFSVRGWPQSRVDPIRLTFWALHGITLPSLGLAIDDRACNLDVAGLMALGTLRLNQGEG